MTIKIGDKTKFFWTNFIKGFIWTIIIIGAYQIHLHYRGVFGLWDTTDLVCYYDRKDNSLC